MVLYSVMTQNVLPQNFLPLLPFTSLAAAVFLATVWQQAAGRWPWLANRRAAATIGTILVIFVSLPAHIHAYRIVVPTTMEKVVSLLATEFPNNSRGWIRMESEGTSPDVLAKEPGRTWRPPSRLLFWSSPRLTDIGQPDLNQSDAEVFPLIRTAGPDRDFYMQRSSHDDRSHTTIVESKAFRSWGPDLVMVLHPWRPLEPRTVELTRVSGGHAFEHRLSAPEEDPQVAAIEISLPGGRRGKKSPRVEIGERRVDLKSISRSRRRELWITDRFRLAASADVKLRIRLPRSMQTDVLKIVVRRWSKSP
jgi:hypothetical protein